MWDKQKEKKKNKSNQSGETDDGVFRCNFPVKPHGGAKDRSYIQNVFPWTTM